MSVISDDTQDQIAAVMLTRGTPKQQAEALDYAGATELSTIFKRRNAMYTEADFKRMNPRLLAKLSLLTGEDRDFDLTLERWYCTSSLWDDELDKFPNMARKFTGSIDAKLPGENIVRVVKNESLPDQPDQWVAWHLNKDGTLSHGVARTEACARRLAFVNSLPVK